MYRLMVGCAGTQGEIRWRGVSSLIAAWMCVGLLIAGTCSAFTASSPLMLRLVHRTGFVFMGLLVVQFGIAIALSLMIGRFSTRQAATLFLMYSALNGFSFSGLFLVLLRVSLAATFVIEAVVFALLSFYGLVTRRDLTKRDGLVAMGLIGMCVASIVLGLLRSPLALWIVTYLGIATFTCLLAFDAQKMKHMDVQADELRASRLAILGALVFYMDVLPGFARLLVVIGRAYLNCCERQYPHERYFPLGMW